MISTLSHMLRERCGSVLILVGLGILVLVGLAGAGIDLGRQQIVSNKLQSACDAAAIAAGSAPAGQEIETARRYFNLNFPDGYLGVTRPTPTVTFGANGASVRASAPVPTLFIRLLGVTTTTAVGRTGTESDSTTNTQKFDVILVMDNSGSMAANDAGGGQTRVGALIVAAKTLVSSLLDPNVAGSRVAGITWDHAVIDTIGFQNTNGPMQSFLDGMTPRGQTNSAVGMTAAQSMVSGFNTDAVKAVVLLTDGVNSPNATSVNANTIIICDNLQAQGVVVYTIALGPVATQFPDVATFLTACASDPGKFYNAPDATALQNVFDAILTSVKKLRITE
ncbi:MAG: vWA domain-containing protein [Alphaproteobacteria bacterium]|jgi:Mg-chelatase subunit ChlD